MSSIHSTTSAVIFTLLLAMACQDEEKPFLPGLPMNVTSVKLQKSVRTNSETILANGVNGIKLEIVFLDINLRPVTVDQHPLQVWVNNKYEVPAPYVFTTTQTGGHTFSLKTSDGAVFSENLFTVTALPVPELSSYRLPVVVHYFHEKEQPLTDTEEAAIASRIADSLVVANEGYANRRGSEDPNALDAGIEFYLATEDPQGNHLKYPGVDFVHAPGMTEDWTDIYAHVNDGHYWPPSHYINLWVIDMDFGGAFAFFPEYEATESGYPDGYYGVFVSRGAFDYAWMGYIFTHEIGHILNLKHVFGFSCAETDECDDTRSYVRPSNGVYNGMDLIRTSCEYERFAATNFMDYANAEYNTFTFRQVLRMRSALSKSPFLPTPENMSGGRKRSNARSAPATSFIMKDAVIN